MMTKDLLIIGAVVALVAIMVLAALPEITSAMPDVYYVEPTEPEAATEAEPGLYHKYRVYDNESGASIDGCFVLRPDKDFAARDALRTYAATTSNRILSKDIINFLESLKPEV